MQQEIKQVEIEAMMFQNAKRAIRAKPGQVPNGFSVYRRVRDGDGEFLAEWLADFDSAPMARKYAIEKARHYGGCRIVDYSVILENANENGTQEARRP